jgi:hypothetical protein
LTPENYLPIAKEGTYTEENLKTTLAISAWNSFNKIVVNETNEIKHNIDLTIDMTIPSNLPVLSLQQMKKRLQRMVRTSRHFMKRN